MAQKKECWNCRYYSTYYSKTFTGLYKEKFGRCAQSNSIVTNHCEKWDNKYPVEKRRKVAAISALVDITETLKIIKQILTDDKDEL